MRKNDASESRPIRFIDLFCGIGGFRYALQAAAGERGIQAECLFSSDIDTSCQDAYEANFGERPTGDITAVSEHLVPRHDVLLAGFPCQPFSIIGTMKGFSDTRGTLFFHIARILAAQQPAAFILENVKLLVGHDQGRTLRKILETLEQIGYHVTFKVLNALAFGLPQKRERIFIVGFRKPSSFTWPLGGIPMKPLSRILEKEVPERFYVSERIKFKRLSVMKPRSEPTIWHENKAGHISAYPYSCALRAGASYNYLLVDGERRLTPRELLRLQGFPETFRIVCNESQTRKQAGNSLPVPVASAVIDRVFESLGFDGFASTSNKSVALDEQMSFLENSPPYHARSETAKRRKIQATLSTK